jgi:hypothetical protein
MAVIAIHDLQPVGNNLFSDNESYLSELSSGDELDIMGGKSSALSFLTGVGITIIVVLILY